MAIRFLLVTLVAAMGFEPPTRDEVSTWTRSGRQWVAARLDDWSVTTAQRAQEANDKSFRSVVETMSRDFSKDLAATELAKLNTKAKAATTFEPIEVPDSLDTGLAFTFEPIEVPDSLDTGVAFTLNQEIAVETAPFVLIVPVFVPASAPIPAKMIVVADAIEEGFALSLNRESDGLSNRVLVSEIEAAPAVAAVEIASVRSDDPSPSSITKVVSDRGDGQTVKLSSALTLTRQALSAWASVLNGSGSMVRR